MPLNGLFAVILNGLLVASPNLNVENQIPAIDAEKIVMPSCRSDKVFSLTFDDGPWPNNTLNILNLLDEKGVKATFFVVGRQVRQHPELLREIASRGHDIGLHTQNHKSLPSLSFEAQNKELRDNGLEVQAVLPDIQLKYWRPPYGALPKHLISYEIENQLKPVLWTVDSNDWRNPSREVYLDNVFKNVQNRGIALFHDHTATTQEYLSEVIDTLLANGFSLISLSQRELPVCPIETTE